MATINNSLITSTPGFTTTSNNNGTTVVSNPSTENTTQNAQSTTNNTSGLNTKAILDKDAFLRLLLVEMQHQDPTDPMDSDKMLTQTSQLAALEMQQNTNDTMQKMVETMNILSQAMLSSGNLTVLSAIGRTAIVAENTFRLSTENESIKAKIYLKDESKDGATFQITNSSGETVRSIKIAKNDLKIGLNEITWDGKDDNGKYVGAGDYSIKTSYTNTSGSTSTSVYGAYPIESVKFENGIAKALVAGQYIEFDQIGEIS